MKTTPDISLGRMAALAVAAALAGCAASAGGQADTARYAEQSATAPDVPPSGPFYAHGETMRGSTGAGATQHSGEGAMCPMHRNMEDGPGEQAQRAMMERRLQGMPPEQRRRHMEMMRRNCP